VHLELESVYFILCHSHAHLGQESTSKSASNSVKCDMVATKAVQDPQWTRLAATDIDVTSKDDSSVPPSTKSQTRATEDRRASSSASTSRCAASSALRCLPASSRRLASQTQSGGGPSSRSQIRVVGRSSHECHPSTFWNSVTSSTTTSAWAVSPGECPSTDAMAEDTTARNTASSPTISVW
jgi:hypothetical protein